MITIRPAARAALLTVIVGVSLGGCTAIRDHRGYVADPVLVQAVQPGIDNRDSVQGTLGRPTFMGQFDQRDWYYVSTNTREYAFATPKPSDQAVLHIRFDANGTVESVENTGLELARAVNPVRGATPTLGRNRNLFQEIFGNIGASGAQGQRGQTSDNPT